jgi:hypothetical protein
MPAEAEHQVTTEKAEGLNLNIALDGICNPQNLK